MKIGEALKKLGENKKKFDVILIHVDSFYNLKYSYFNMGLLYIATFLEKNGYRVRCVGSGEIFGKTDSEIKRIFAGSRPAIVGFYTVSDNIYPAANFAKNIKKWLPETLIVAGGPLATSLGENIFDYGNFDVCVMGEGEIPMLQLASLKIKNEGIISDIPGLIYKDSDGETKINPPSPPLSDLDSLPFPDHSLSGSGRNFHVVSGRGCPYNCIFCFQGVHGLKYRYRSAGSVTEEIINNLDNSEAACFDIIDDTFISNPQRVKEISGNLEEYRNRSGRDFAFFCQGRADIIDKHPEMLENLKKAGLVRVQIGIESGNPETLRHYDKRIRIEEIERVAKKAFDAGGMCLVGNFIIGGPFESERTFEDSLDLAKRLVSIAPGVFEAGAAFMGPYPGTPIASNPSKYGLKTIDCEFKKGLTLSDVHMTTESLGVNELRMLGERFSSEILAQMEKEIGNIPGKQILSHFMWAENYNIHTLWYMHFLSKRDALAAYFNYMKSPRFLPLSKIPASGIYDYYPLRVMEERKYSKDGGKILLPLTISPEFLEDPDEILIYELSSGKLTIGQMVDEFIKERKKDFTEGEIIEKIFIPAFMKLEKSYQIVFSQGF